MFVFYCAVFSVSCSLVVTCWQRADLLAHVCVVFFLVFVLLSHMCLELWSTSELRVRLVLWNMFKPSNFLLTIPRQGFFCWLFLLFMFHVCLCYSVLSVPCSHVITCWERTDLLALLWVMFFFSYFLSLFLMVFWVRCGTWLFDSWSLPSSLLWLNLIYIQKWDLKTYKFTRF